MSKHEFALTYNLRIIHWIMTFPSISYTYFCDNTQQSTVNVCKIHNLHQFLTPKEKKVCFRMKCIKILISYLKIFAVKYDVIVLINKKYSSHILKNTILILFKNFQDITFSVENTYDFCYVILEYMALTRLLYFSV